MTDAEAKELLQPYRETAMRGAWQGYDLARQQVAAFDYVLQALVDRAAADAGPVGCPECRRLREQRDVLRNALEAVLHGDYVHYELSETPRKLVLAALVAVACPPEVKRFWRLVQMPWGAWRAEQCLLDGTGLGAEAGSMGPRPTRAEAVTGGMESGLPEWPGGKP